MKEVEVEKKKRSTLPSRRRRLWKQFNQLTFASSLIFLSRAAAARSNASTPTGLGLPLKSLCTPCWSEPMPATITLMSTKGSADSPGIFFFFLKARAAAFSLGGASARVRPRGAPLGGRRRGANEGSRERTQRRWLRLKRKKMKKKVNSFFFFRHPRPRKKKKKPSEILASRSPERGPLHKQPQQSSRSITSTFPEHRHLLHSNQRDLLLIIFRFTKASF